MTSTNDSTAMIAAAASSPSLAFAPNFESADGIAYWGLSALASLSMADSDSWEYGNLDNDLDSFGVEKSDDIEFVLRTELKKQLKTHWTKLENYQYDRNFTLFITGGNASEIKKEILKVLNSISDLASSAVLLKYQKSFYKLKSVEKTTSQGLIKSFSRKLLLRDKSYW